LSYEQARFYAANITSAFEYLHSREICYRDLKPENVLINTDGYCKVADMGFAKRLKNGEKTFTVCGTAEYLAPEIYALASWATEKATTGYGAQCDWWALGALLYEMITEAPPFEGDAKEIAQKQKLDMEIPDSIRPDAAQIIKQFLAMDPVKRLGMSNGSCEARRHQFFSDIDFIKLVKKELPAPYVPSVGNAQDTSHFEADQEEPNLEKYHEWWTKATKDKKSKVRALWANW